MSKKSTTRMLQGTWLLVMSSFIVKILSAIYRVPFQNMVGDEGFYVYQQVYPIYGLAVTLSLNGIPLFLSKLVAEERDFEKKQEKIQLVFWLSLLLSVALFLVFFLFSVGIAKAMGDALLSPVIRVTSFSFLLTPWLAIYRGYFQGELNVTATAHSQLWEQTIRVVMILIAAYWYTQASFSLYQMGAYASTGAVVGGVAALIVLMVYRYRSQTPALLWPLKMSQKHSVEEVTKRLFTEGALIWGYSANLMFCQFIDSFSLKNGLVAHGYLDLQAKMVKGAFDRGQPFVQVGLVIALSFVTSYLPRLTKAQQQSSLAYQAAVRQVVKIMRVLSSAATVGLIVLLPELNRVLFGDTQETLALRLFTVIVYVLSMIQVFQMVGQSMGQTRTLAWGLVISLVLKMALSYPFVKWWGTVGASLSTVIAFLTSLFFLRKELYPQARQSRAEVVPLVIALGKMALSVIIYKKVIQVVLPALYVSRLTLFVVVLIGVLVGVVVFARSVWRAEIFTLEEWSLIPLGDKIKKKR